MRAIITFALVILLALCADSAQPIKRGDRNSNLAVMLAYRPNSEIRSRDKSNNKSWTYNIEDEKDSVNSVNDQLLEALIKDKFAKRFNLNEVDERKTVKRENADCDSESSESLENNEAKIVQLGTKNEKKTCYKKTYKNVLNAFEQALKSQIENYKKCVCQKKVSPPATEAPTTTQASEPSDIGQRNLSDEDEDDSKVAIDNEDAMLSALDDKDGVICFHHQHAFMLKKILDRIPCAKPKDELEPEMEADFNGEPVKRAERNNNVIAKQQAIAGESEESLEIDISEITQKPTATTAKPSRIAMKEVEKSNDDKLNEKILAVLEEHFKLSRNEKLIEKNSQKTLRTSPKKITIKGKQVQDEEKNPQEETEEVSQQEFMKQLQDLFKKYQVASDETFPMQSGERFVESTPRMPPNKSSNKLTTSKTVVESSDESTEAAFKLKSRKLKRERLQIGENTRKSASSRINAISHNNIDNDSKVNFSSTSNSPKKSYRSSSRSSVRVNEKSSNIAEKENVSKTYIAKKSHRVTRSTRPPVDGRLASDFAKKISDFARGKSSRVTE